TEVSGGRADDPRVPGGAGGDGLPGPGAVADLGGQGVRKRLRHLRFGRGGEGPGGPDLPRRPAGPGAAGRPARGGKIAEIIGRGKIGEFFRLTGCGGSLRCYSSRGAILLRGIVLSS